MIYRQLIKFTLIKKLYFLLTIGGLAAFTACTDHEIVPPPVPLVDLNCECSATINDSSVTYIDSCSYSSEKNIVSGGISNARYQTRIWTEGIPGGLQIEMRSLTWSDDGSNNPTLAEWKTFFMDNTTPDYSGGVSHNGVYIEWTDLNGNVWKSDTSASICVESFVYNTLIQESDTTGKYMQFDATFDCKLINSDYGVIDSIKCVENAHVRSAFRLQ